MEPKAKDIFSFRPTLRFTLFKLCDVVSEDFARNIPFDRAGFPKFRHYKQFVTNIITESHKKRISSITII